jgi:hypothetical protein
MAKIDITMTAVIRPTILERTLESIVKNIVTKEHRFRLIINIDPVGEKTKPKVVMRVAEKYFKHIVYNHARQPSFPKAVIWVWKNSDAPYIFHIEDDWSINRKINVSKMINILDNHKELSSLRLYKYTTPKGQLFSTFGCKWRYNKEGFYVADGWQKQFGLNPILIKRQFIDEALPRMRENVNPEKQFRSSQKYMVPVIEKWKYGLYASPSEKALISDIGHAWRRRTRFVKPRGSFVTWEVKRK